MQVRAKLSDNKVNGPEDAIVSEMIKKVAHGKDLQYHEVFPGTFHGHDGASKLVEGGEVGVLEEGRMHTRQKGSEVTEQ